MSGDRTVGGPGTVRVGRYIGRLGVVSMPAIATGLDLDERVVRRHIAKLETAGWLRRTPWIRGEGSAVWLTATGTEAVGLGGVGPIRSPPRSTTLTHGILVGWTAARIQRRGLVWRASRELAVDPERWAVPARGEHAHTSLLPDLAAWLEESDAPVALIVESGGRREDRQKRILEGWRDALYNNRYRALQYDCADPSVTRWIQRLATKVGSPDRTSERSLRRTPPRSTRYRPPDPEPAEPTMAGAPRPAAPTPANDQPPAPAAAADAREYDQPALAIPPTS